MCGGFVIEGSVKKGMSGSGSSQEVWLDGGGGRSSDGGEEDEDGRFFSTPLKEEEEEGYTCCDPPSDDHGDEGSIGCCTGPRQAPK